MKCHHIIISMLIKYHYYTVCCIDDIYAFQLPRDQVPVRASGPEVGPGPPVFVSEGFVVCHDGPDWRGEFLPPL